MTDTASSPVDAVLFDIDGTLIDSSYHHALAWLRAFESHGLRCEAWRVHRSIGMGGDHLVAHLFDEATEERLGDELRDAWQAEYEKLSPEVHAFERAGEVVVALRERGLKVALASSSPQSFTDLAIELMGLDADDFDAVTTSADAQSAKPDPDIFQIALDRVGGTRAIVVGDSTWDAIAARGIDAAVIAVRTGGFGEDELKEAGAVLVVDAVADLLDADWDALTA